MQHEHTDNSRSAAHVGSTSPHMNAVPDVSVRLRLIRRPDVEALTGLRSSMIYALMAKGQFPATIKSGARTVGWIEAEVSAWVAARVAESRGGAA